MDPNDIFAGLVIQVHGLVVINGIINGRRTHIEAQHRQGEDAGIMLANNTCDLEVDIRNHRFTLVYYLGKARALALYTGLQVLPWLVLLGLALTGRLPLWGLVTFAGLALHWPKVATFRAKQVKRETFVLSVQSFVLVASLYCAWLLLGILLS